MQICWVEKRSSQFNRVYVDDLSEEDVDDVIREKLDETIAEDWLGCEDKEDVKDCLKD